MFNKMGKKLFFGLSNLNLEEAFEAYIDIVECYNKDKDEKNKMNVLSKKSFEKKCLFFVHNLISRQLLAGRDSKNELKKEMAYLNARILERVFGKDYKRIIEVLKRLKIIKVDEQFIKGKKNKGYSVIDLNKYITSSKKPYYYPCQTYVKKY